LKRQRLRPLAFSIWGLFSFGDFFRAAEGRALKKKRECEFDKTSDRRKGPSLKAGNSDFMLQGPEDPCPLREYEPHQDNFPIRS